jgi:hypothetical protein
MAIVLSVTLMAGLISAVRLHRWLGGPAATLAGAGFGTLLLGHWVDVGWQRSVSELATDPDLPAAMAIASLAHSLISVVGVALIIAALVAVAMRLRGYLQGPGASSTSPSPAAAGPGAGSTD